MLDQKEMMTLWMPILRERGKPFRKFRKVLVRKAKEGEVIYTITNDGVETQNTAHRGDFIIRNQTGAKEEYILKPAKFHEKYRPLRSLEEGWTEYQAVGQVIAIEMNEKLLAKINRKKYFRFIAPWGAPMILRLHDFLVCPIDGSEIYRIARKEFFETYKKA
ncbi:MAG: hypothetical protein AAF985_21485 [Bacteroidota bacterium]